VKGENRGSNDYDASSGPSGTVPTVVSYLPPDQEVESSFRESESRRSDNEAKATSQDILGASMQEQKNDPRDCARAVQIFRSLIGRRPLRFECLPHSYQSNQRNLGSVRHRESVPPNSRSNIIGDTKSINRNGASHPKRDISVVVDFYDHHPLLSPLGYDRPRAGKSERRKNRLKIQCNSSSGAPFTSQKTNFGFLAT